MKDRIHREKNSILKEKISVIKEIACAITSTSSLDSITNLILDLALSYTNASSGSILLLNRHGDLVVNAARGMDPDIMKTIKVGVGEFICGKVARDKTPLLVKDINQSKQFKRKRQDKYYTQSFICCPIVMKETLLGVINIKNKIDGKAFTEDDLDLINILSNQAAIALEQTRLISKLRTTASALDEINRGLISTDRLRTEFIANISHALRTPLNSLKGALYYLKESKPLAIEKEEFLGIVSNETERLIKLLYNLLDFFQLADREIEHNKRVLNFRDMLNEAIATRMVRDALAKKKLSINITGADSLSGLVGERKSVLLALINVIDGLAGYATYGRAIEIRVRKTRNAAKIIFLASGTKFPEHELPHFFDERSVWCGIDADKERMKFYLAKKSVDLNKATIDVTNTQSGPSVHLTFPINRVAYRDAIMNEVTSLFLSFVSESMNVNRCSIMLLNRAQKSLAVKNAIGMDPKVMSETSVKVGDGISGTVAAESKPLFIRNIEKHPGIRSKNRPQYNTKSLLCLPIILHNKTIGVLNLTNKADGADLSMIDLYLASVITERIAYVIGTIEKIDRRANRFGPMIMATESLVTAERKHKEKNGHVTDLVYSIMQHMHKPEDDIKVAVYASKLYDIGITQIDDTIIKKSSRLSDIEKKIIRTHPFPGARLIDYLERDETVKLIILHHHENYDGTGYPSGLQGDNIPFISRVIAVADSYSAMISDRPYRKALTKRNALNQIKKGSGTLYDPQVVEAFTRIV